MTADNRAASLEANRRGELTAEQHALLSFTLEKEQLGAITASLIALAATVTFGCILGWSFFQGAGWELFAAIVVLFGLFLFDLWNSQRSVRRLRRARDRLRRGEVVCTEGQVRWDGRRYAVQFRGAEKLTVDAQLAPGEYDFYHVPFSGVAISYERVSTVAQAQAGLLDALMRARAFDAEALAANRAGHLQSEQKTKLWRSLLLWTGGRSFGLLLGGALFVWVCANYQIGRGIEYGWTAVMASAPPLILLAAVLADFAQKLADLRGDQVLAVLGVGVRGPREAEWQVGCLRFSVAGRSTRALITGFRYRAYYLPRSRYLLSLEPLASKA